MNHLKQDAFTNNQFIIIELISTFFIIIALILLSVQGVDNFLKIINMNNLCLIILNLK